MTDAARPRRGRRRAAEPAAARAVDYRQLRNPFTPVDAFSKDREEALHDTALRVLEELGVKVLLPEARDLFKAAGARVDLRGLAPTAHLGHGLLEGRLEIDVELVGQAQEDPQHVGHLACDVGGVLARLDRLGPGGLVDPAGELADLLAELERLLPA